LILILPVSIVDFLMLLRLQESIWFVFIQFLLNFQVHDPAMQPAECDIYTAQKEASYFRFMRRKGDQHFTQGHTMYLYIENRTMQ